MDYSREASSVLYCLPLYFLILPQGETKVVDIHSLQILASGDENTYASLLGLHLLSSLLYHKC